MFKSSDTNYVNKPDDFVQQGPYAKPSKLMPRNSYLASFVNQNAVPIVLFC